MVRPALDQGRQRSRAVEGGYETPRVSCRTQQETPPDRAELLGAIHKHRMVRSHWPRELGPHGVPGISVTGTDPHLYRLAGQGNGEFVQERCLAAAFRADDR